MTDTTTATTDAAQTCDKCGREIDWPAVPPARQCGCFNGPTVDERRNSRWTVEQRHDGRWYRIRTYRARRYAERLVRRTRAIISDTNDVRMIDRASGDVATVF